MTNPFAQDTTAELLKNLKEIQLENETMPFQSIIEQNMLVIASITEVLTERGVAV